MYIQAYRFYMKHNGVPVDNNMKDLINRINAVPEKFKMRKTHYNYPILLDVKREYNTPFITAVSFHKKREEYKPYVEKEENNKRVLRLIEDPVIELTSGVVDHQHNLIILQRNHYGLARKAIEYYLNTFLLPDEGFEVVVEEIVTSIELEEIYNSDRISAIEPIFYDGLFDAAVEDMGMFGTIVGHLFGENDGNPQMSFVVKRTGRGTTLQGKSVKKFIELLEQGEISQHINDINITYRPANASKNVTKSINSLKGVIEREVLKKEKNPSFEIIHDTMHEKHSGIRNETDTRGENLIRGMEAAREYHIKEIPDEKHLVEID